MLTDEIILKWGIGHQTTYCLISVLFKTRW